MTAQRIQPPAQEQSRKGIIEILESKKSDLQAAFPKGNSLTVDRIIVSVRLAMANEPKLAICDPMSVFRCTIRCAQLGLHPGPLGEAYLVPFKTDGVMIATLIIGYQGMIALARRSGVVLSIDADIVRENDYFDYEKGTNAHIKHVPDFDNLGTIRGAYAIATLQGGIQQFTYMPWQELELIRDRSKSGKNGPWVTDWAEMAKKTVIRRLFKLLPKSLEMADAMQDDDIIDVPQVAPTFAEPKHRALPNPDLEAPSILDEIAETRRLEQAAEPIKTQEQNPGEVAERQSPRRGDPGTPSRGAIQSPALFNTEKVNPEINDLRVRCIDLIENVCDNETGAKFRDEVVAAVKADDATALQAIRARLMRLANGG